MFLLTNYTEYVPHRRILAAYVNIGLNYRRVSKLTNEFALVKHGEEFVGRRADQKIFAAVIFPTNITSTLFHEENDICEYQLKISLVSNELANRKRLACNYHR